MADQQCELFLEPAYASRCRRRATWTVVTGCVHEHMSRRLVCDDCHEDAAAGAVGCAQCEAAGHACSRALLEAVRA